MKIEKFLSWRVLHDTLSMSTLCLYAIIFPGQNVQLPADIKSFVENSSLNTRVWILIDNSSSSTSFIIEYPQTNSVLHQILQNHLVVRTTKFY